MQSRFDFLADIFPPSLTIPPLAVLAECGKEAEENLHSNTRYSLICLGDIGESLAYTLLNFEKLPQSINQNNKIKMLVNSGALDKDTGDIFHRLRMARNSAVHGRYSPEADAEKLIDEALALCEKIFMILISPGDILRGNIIKNDGENLSVKIGNFIGTVKHDEIPENFLLEKNPSEKILFRVLGVDGKKISLSLKNINSDPWAIMAERYKKYSEGQEVFAAIKSFTRSLGAVVELQNDGLEARIPVAELNSNVKMSSKKKKRSPKIICAIVKWCDPQHFPYMVLSPKEIKQPENLSESAAKNQRRNNKILAMINNEKQKLKKALNSQLLQLCNKYGTPEQIREVLEAGADVNAKNSSKSTPLMLAAQRGELEVIKVILSYKPNLNAQSKTGNTALHIAALHVHADIMLEILKAGAAWDIPNKNHMTAFEITKTLKKLQNSEAMKFMEKSQQKNFLQLCRSGTEQEIKAAIDAGENINVISKSGAGALTFAARGNTAGAVEVLLNAGIDPDVQDIHANTALIYAAAYNSDDVVDALIEGGAEVNVINNEGRKALDYARQNYRLADTEALKTLEALTRS